MINRIAKHTKKAPGKIQMHPNPMSQSTWYKKHSKEFGQDQLLDSYQEIICDQGDRILQLEAIVEQKDIKIQLLHTKFRNLIDMVERMTGRKVNGKKG